MTPDTALRPLTNLPPGIAELFPAARTVRDALNRDAQQRLTRDALAAWLRENGHPVGNSRLAPLLQALRSETANPPATCTYAVA